ncbi:fimbrial protein, partial [Priestia aryabhattai]|uniref:fimbrial protein n=1 Tax=Priestia aryabhattai TaxID=412384 RepID=UPI000C0285E7
MTSKVLSSMLGSALLLSIAGVHAEDGTITLTGSIQDGTCSIASDSKAITVDFGSVSTGNGGNNKYTKKAFKINLTDCPSSVSSAIVSWTASNLTSSTDTTILVDGEVPDEVYATWEIIAGIDNTTNTVTNPLKLDGSPEPAKNIVAGNNNLDYTTAMG